MARRGGAYVKSHATRPKRRMPLADTVTGQLYMIFAAGVIFGIAQVDLRCTLCILVLVSTMDDFRFVCSDCSQVLFRKLKCDFIFDLALVCKSVSLSLQCKSDVVAKVIIGLALVSVSFDLCNYVLTSALGDNRFVCMQPPVDPFTHGYRRSFRAPSSGLQELLSSGFWYGVHRGRFCMYWLHFRLKCRHGPRAEGCDSQSMRPGGSLRQGWGEA